MSLANSLKLGEVKDYFDRFNMMEFKLDNNIITVSKPNYEKLQFELHSFGETKMIMKEVKAFKLDESAMSECIWLTKYFGPFNITKTYEDRFVFSKDGQSAVVSKYKW